jgi:brefeldin A-inhibited guanine nucleotide-exchange protein
MPPSYSTAAVGSAEEIPSTVSEARLRQQSLECMVSVLHSLVTWGTAISTSVGAEQKSNAIEDSAPNGSSISESAIVSSPSLERLSEGRLSTPDLADDPGMFESAKQRKTILLEGIKQFNFKPKRVGYVLRSSVPVLT